MQGSLDWTIRVLHFGELWKSKDLANGFAEFPGEIPRSLKILECFCVDLSKQSSKTAWFSQKSTRLMQDGCFFMQAKSLAINPRNPFGGQAEDVSKTPVWRPKSF